MKDKEKRRETHRAEVGFTTCGGGALLIKPETPHLDDTLCESPKHSKIILYAKSGKY